MENKVSWITRASIGATGGISLSLLKLIEEGFYLSSPKAEMIAGILTYVAYVILGMILAVQFTDHELPLAKIRKNAFVYGVLAPSLLIALIKSPISTGTDSFDILNLDQLSSNNVDFRQPGLKKVHYRFAQNYAQTEIKEVPKNSFSPGFTDALYHQLRGSQPTKALLYVIGESHNSERVLAIADEFNRMVLLTNDRNAVEILKPEGSKKYFLVLGQIFSSYDQAQRYSRELVLKIYDTQPSSSMAKLVLKGKVVEGWELLNSK